MLQEILNLTPENTATALSIVAALWATGSAIWTHKAKKKYEHDLKIEFEEHRRKLARADVILSFRNPLMIACFDLQSRIYNVVNNHFYDVYFLNGDETSREYVLQNTSYVISQYFGWIELIRREVQFIDIEGQDDTKKLTNLMDDIVECWGTDKHGQAFRIFAGDQRAIGEMMVEKNENAESGVIGYKKYIDNMKTINSNPFRKLITDIAKLEVNSQESIQRLRMIQHALIELLEFLDPKYERFSKKKRQKA